MECIGHQYYMAWNGILHVLGHPLDLTVLRTLDASYGMFVPGQFRQFPEELSQSDVRLHLGSGLSNIEA